MEEDKGVHIACIGHAGVGKNLLINAITERMETIDVYIPDEFERANLKLTDEQKEALRAIGVTPQMLNNITTEEELLAAIAEKWNESIINPSKTIKKKSKSWNKKHFWD